MPAQATIRRGRSLGRFVEAEQIVRRPAQRLNLIAPAGEEAAAVLDGLVPAIGLDVIGAAELKGRKAGHERAGDAVRLDRLSIRIGLFEPGEAIGPRTLLPAPRPSLGLFWAVF